MGDLQGGWRRAIMPGTVRRRKSPPRRLVLQKPLPFAPCMEYFPPERRYDYDLEDPKPKVKRNRRCKMGEAKDIVGEVPKTKKSSRSTEDKPDLPFKARRKSGDIADRVFERASGSGVLKELSGVTDRLDRAIEVKMVDLDNEPTQIAENHVKVLLHGEKIADLCVGLKNRYNMPPTDEVITRMIIVECDEPDIWVRANAHGFYGQKPKTEEDLARIVLQKAA